jgi:hypothetical protein
MNADATVAQISCIGVGGRRFWAGRCGGNARNRVCRLRTDMRTTQGQAAFGHNVQAIINLSCMVQTSCDMYRWTRIVNARRMHLLQVQTLTNRFVLNYCNLRIIPAQLSRSAKQHPSKSTHLLIRFVRGLSIYVYQFFIPIDLRA